MPLKKRRDGCHAKYGHPSDLFLFTASFPSSLVSLLESLVVDIQGFDTKIPDRDCPVLAMYGNRLGGCGYMAFSSGDILLAANMAPLAFNAFLAMAALGAPSVAALCEILATASGKVFYKKAAQQLGILGLGCTAYTLFVAAGTLLLIYLKIPGLLPFEAPEQLPLLWLFAPMAIWVLASTAHTATWKKMKKKQALHMVLGGLAAISGLLTIYASIAIKYAYILPVPGERPLPETAGALFIPGNAPIFWALLVSMLLLAPLAICALGLGFILYRRKKDDWGRDYYIFAIRFVSGLAACLGILFLGSQAWLASNIQMVFGQLVAMQNIVPAWYVGMGTGLGSVALWSIVNRNTMPMRLSSLLILSCLFIWTMLTCLGFSGLKLFFLY